MKRMRAFTLVELLVVIGIIALLISILLPTLNKARQQALLVSCQAKMRDIGQAIVMYAGESKQYFPGPCWGQVHAGYRDALDMQLPNYIWRFLRLPPPQSTTNFVVMEALYCPGYKATNPGIDPNPDLWTYGLGGGDYPWFGYPSPSSWSNADHTGYADLHPERLFVISGRQIILPMKIGQVYKSSEQLMMSDSDNAQYVYSVGPPGNPNAYQNLTLSKVPNHGGRAESKIGDRTNPPRNYMFMDGHVVTIRNSDGPPIPPTEPR